MGRTGGLEGLQDSVLGTGTNHVLDGFSDTPSVKFRTAPQDFSIILFRSKDPYTFIFKHTPLLLYKFEQY